MTRRRHGYHVGITLSVDGDGDPGLYGNGLRQNVVFLHQLFRAAPGCAQVRLLNCSEAAFAGWPAGLGMEGAPVARIADVADTLDYLIVIGGSPDPAALRGLRDRGVGIVGYKGGNGAVIAMEAMAATPRRADAESYADLGLYDAIWMTPQHLATYAGWCRTLYRVPVHPVPHIWAPTFVDARRATLGDRFGYRPGAKRWRVGILEPNTTVMKTAHVPMLACEAAYRHDPAAFEAVYVAGTIQHRDDPHFRSFASALSIVRDGVMSFEPRFVAADFLAHHCDAVVAHQWENGLNYLYYEVLHGGYPLIHNSAFLGDHGYPYADFDAEAGGAALLDAFAHHDARLAEHRSQTAALLASASPLAPETIALHERLLTAG